MKNNQILFLTALKSEAIPIIKKYKLDSVPKYEKLKIYQKDNIYLLIIGIGKRNTINSIQKYIKESNNIKNMICINIGSAGGNSSVSKIGELFYINKITDDITKKSFFPDVLFHHRMKESELVTVKEPILNKNKRYKTLIDMEAYWIFDILNSFIPSHRLIFIKIISDHMNFNKINKAKFEQLSKILIEENLQKVERYISMIESSDIISERLISYEEKQYIEKLKYHLSLTETQKYKLDKLSENRSYLCKDILTILEPYAKINTVSKHKRNKIFNKICEKLST